MKIFLTKNTEGDKINGIKASLVKILFILDIIYDEDLHEMCLKNVNKPS